MLEDFLTSAIEFVAFHWVALSHLKGAPKGFLQFYSSAIADGYESPLDEGDSYNDEGYIVRHGEVWGRSYTCCGEIVAWDGDKALVEVY